MYLEQNKATCRRFIQQVFNEGDLSAMHEFVSPDSLHHELDDWSVPLGQTAKWLADMIYLYRAAFPDFRMDIQGQIAESDRVVTSLRIQGTQEGRLMGIGASGKPMDIAAIRVDRLAEGKIAESWFHMDTLGMLQQIEALPDLNRNPKVAPRAKNTPSVPTVKPFPVSPEGTEMPRPAAVRLKPAA